MSTTAQTENDLALIRDALGGQRAATSQLLSRLMPAVQARVAVTLLGGGRRPRGRDPRQEVADLTQEVLATLFDDGGRVLRDWDPSRGASLTTFVGLIAERRVGHVLRSKRQSPWTAEPVEDEQLEATMGSSAGHEGEVMGRDLADRVWHRLRSELSPKGVAMFEALFLDGRDVAELSAEVGMGADAIYAWKSRLGRRAREIMIELSSEARLLAAKSQRRAP